MAAPAAVLSILVNAQTGPAVRGLARVNTQLDSTAGKASKSTAALKTVGKVGAVGLAVGIGFAVKKAADFESQMSSLGAVTDASGRDMKRFKKQALDAGAATKFSALDAAKAQTELAKGGLSVRDIMRGGLKSALALAAAGEMDLAEAAATTANAMNLFGLKGKDAMKVADALATAANATTADVTDFAMALKQGGAVAKMAGLSFTETVLALEALAKSGTKNADAGTSMKTAFIQLLKPSAKQAALADKLGLNFITASGSMKSMSDISAMLRDKLGGMTKAQRTAALATLAGTDGVRTLNALYDAGPRKLDRWKAGLDKSGTAATVAAKKQDNLKGKLENLQGSLETLAIVVGSALLPALSDGAVAATKFINSLTSGQGAGGQITATLNQLRTSLNLSKQDWLAFSQAAQNAWKGIAAVEGRVLPGMIQQLRGFLQIAGGIIKIFTGILTLDFSRAWAGVRQIFSGALNAIIGNLRVITAPFRAAVAAIANAIKGPLGAAWNAMKVAARAALTGTLGLLRTFTSPHRAAAKALGSAVSGPLGTAFRAARTVAGTVIRAILGLLRSMASPWKAAASVLGSAIRGPVGHALTAMRANAGKVLSALRSAFSSTAGKVLRTMSRLGGGIAVAATGIAAAFNALARVVKGVISYITRAINKLVGAIGKAKDKIAGLAPSLPSLPSIPNVPGIPGIQRGAYVAKGKSSGDSVPAMLEKGEYVLNRRAVKKTGRKQLDQLNYGMAPRFQRGGPVGMARGGLAGMIAAANKLDRAQFPYQWGGGHQGTPAPFGPMDCSGAVSFVLQHGGVKIPTMTSGALASAGQAGPGKVTVFANPRHTYMRIGNRYFGTSTANPGGGAGWFPGAPRSGFSVRHFPASGAMGAFGDAAAQIPAINVKGSGMVTDLAQGATNKMRGVANAHLARVMEPIGSGDAQFTKGQYGKSQLKRLWIQAGGSRGMANTMAAIALAESGGDSGIQNSIGASGLWQIHPPQPGWQDPLKNARMAVGKLASQGLSAWSVYTNGDYRQFLQQGGMVEMLQAGGLSGDLTRTVGLLGASPKPGKGIIKRRRQLTKKRSKALKDLLKRIKGIGLPTSLEDALTKHSTNAKTYGELADRAGQLTVTPESGAAIQGKANGLTEAEWLNKQLTSLFAYRNAIISAHDQVVAKRERVTKMIEQARKAYFKVIGEIKKANRRKKTIAKQLAVLRKHPKRNKTAIKRLHKEGMTIDKAQARRGRVRDVIKDKILPALRDRRTTLNTRRGDILGELETVQGVGSPMGVLKSLPALGVLGGDIFSAQMRLRELGQKPAVSDTSAGAADTSERDELKRLLAQDWARRFQVSEAQFKVLRGVPVMGAFAKGGVALVGERGPELAHMPSGTRVHSATDTQAMLEPDVQVHIHGDIVNTPRGKDPVEVVIGDRRFKAAVQGARFPGRRLPGGGGGLQ